MGDAVGARAENNGRQMTSLRELFMLDPDVIFLNHGSFGATPRPVFEVYQTWLRRMEHQPVYFVDQELPELLATARQALGTYLNVDAGEVAYVPNATFGVNVVAQSLALGPGDEVLATDHEYGACDRTWHYFSQKRGFSYLRQPITLPATSSEQIIDHLWQGVTPRTKVIFISHITSPTALTMPVGRICAKAREAGILTLVDGAHAPGQIKLDLKEIGADFYVGNGHKWLCGPKGSAFLYTRQERQGLIEPLVVGWGWGEERTLTFGSDYLDYLQWWGTMYIATYLAIPAAIQFQAEHNWPAVREGCHSLARQAIQRIDGLTGLPSMYPDEPGWFHQMAIAQLPFIAELKSFKAQLYEQFKIEIPCIEWNDRQFIRVSVQGYNTQSDIEALLQALKTLLA